MTHFDWFGLAPAFALDAAALRQRYIALSRELHPDRHQNDTPNARAINATQAANTNEAYETLRDPERRTAYLLALHGLLGEGVKQELPPAFLMETLELNEALQEADSPAALSVVTAQIEAIEAQLNTQLQAAQTAHDTAQNDTERSTALQNVQQAYLMRKYLLRLRAQAANFAAR